MMPLALMMMMEDDDGDEEAEENISVKPDLMLIMLVCSSHSDADRSFSNSKCLPNVHYMMILKCYF